MKSLLLLALLASAHANAAEAVPNSLLLCGMGEVFMIDAAATEKGTFKKLWSWRAKDRQDLPEAQRGRFGTTDDCKPVDGGRKVLISSSSSGCALVEYPSGKVLWHGHVQSAHSLELLPRERVVVAGSTGGSGNRLVVFDIAQSDKPLYETPLPSGHGVVWDESRKCLWALGLKELRRYELNDWESDKPSLVMQASHALPGEDGHDLVAVPNSADLIVSTHGHVYLFDRDKLAFRLHPDLGDKALVKSVSIHPTTGRTVFIQATDKAWWSGLIRFQSPAGEITPPNEKLYKARWMPSQP